MTDTGEVVQVDALSAFVHQLIEQGGDGGEEGEDEGEDDDDGDDDDDSDDDDEGGPSGYDLPLRLRLAAMNGDTSEIESLIAEGFAVDEHGPTKATPLLVASEHGHHETVSVLCAAGAAVDHVNRDGDTALILAVDQHHVETVSVLCAAGADVNQGDAVGRTPLFSPSTMATWRSSSSSLSYGAHPPSRHHGHHGIRTAVDMATRRGHDELAKWLFASEGMITPLHYLRIVSAARARDLIRGGADSTRIRR